MSSGFVEEEQDNGTDEPQQRHGGPAGELRKTPAATASFQQCQDDQNYRNEVPDEHWCGLVG